jgi:radical SAM superfamily enzyme YgiQ (UPF0313 family)
LRILLVCGASGIGRIGNAWTSTIPLTLPYLAALAPDDVQVEIRYLGHNPIDKDFDVDYDLVAVSTLTTHAKASFQVADRFRERGRKVVIGGVHPTILPDKALEHADSVAIGEGEYIWPQIIEDARNNRLQKYYKQEKLPDLAGIPSPRYELLDLGKNAGRIYYPVLTSKGCPNRCEFCFIPELFGRTVRCRPVEDVIADIEALIRTTEVRKVLFVDDNIIANRGHAKELFRQMIPLNVKWAAECTLDIANDKELLDLAFRSGCAELSVGLESTNQESLLEVGKRCNRVERYPEQIREIQKKGIVLVANVMFGFDHDTKDTLLETGKFLTQCKLQFVAPFILRPIVGTRFYKRMEEEGRLLPEAFQEHTRTDVVAFVPKRMAPAELEELFLGVVRSFYSLPSVFRRLLFPPSHLRREVLLMNLFANLRLIQWPRLKRIPILNRILRALGRRIQR